jgi:hypothetical protein
VGQDAGVWGPFPMAAPAAPALDDV